MSQNKHASDFRPGRAVVVNSDPMMADLVRKSLNVLKFESVYVVDTSAEAMQYVVENSEFVDLIAISLDMREGDGFQLIERLAAHGFDRDMVVISDRPQNMLEAATDLAAGLGIRVIGGFAPPFALQDFISAVRNQRRVDSKISKNTRSPASIVEGDLRAAIRNWKIEAAFQPKICLLSDDVVGMEALIRWDHPEAGIIGPNRFLSRIESEGLIDELTEQILHQSLLVLKESQNYCPQLSVSINLSGLSFANTELPERLASAVDAMGINHDHIVFEVTEQQVFDDLTQTLASVSRLGLMGFGLSLDDFGTGFSSL